jgi:hypothetical protein
MVADLLALTWAYSCYLTIRNWQIIVYIILMTIIIINGGFNFASYDSWKLLPLIIKLVIYALMIILVWKAWRAFRNFGGNKRQQEEDKFGDMENLTKSA